MNRTSPVAAAVDFSMQLGKSGLGRKMTAAGGRFQLQFFLLSAVLQNYSSHLSSHRMDGDAMRRLSYHSQEVTLLSQPLCCFVLLFVPFANWFRRTGMTVTPPTDRPSVCQNIMGVYSTLRCRLYLVSILFLIEFELEICRFLGWSWIFQSGSDSWLQIERVFNNECWSRSQNELRIVSFRK